MNILYYDCFAGVSGDMNLAAMIDLGVEPDYLRCELSRLGLDHEFELVIAKDSRHGIHGTRVDVVLKNGGDEHRHDGHIHGDTPHAGHHHGHDDHAHHHGDARHECGHAHGHAHDHEQTHGPHRNLAKIEAIIQGSSLDPAVKETSLAIFRRVAEAEAKVHGKAVEEVHFHEVGATDSIVDIVGAAICFHRLGMDAVWASPVELGGGFVHCAHGTIPVPAPATVEILHGVPTTRGAVLQETTTPTGAAVLAALVDRFTDSPRMVADRTAYGIGHRHSDIPNVLRVHLARVEDGPEAWIRRDASLLQCNIDDMTAEMLGVVMEDLMAAGAMDVHFTPVQMKKNRPATCLSLLCTKKDEARFTDLIFSQTTTLGIKSFPVGKSVLEIAFEKIETPLGPVTFKHALRNGKVVRSKPELEDCRRLSVLHGIPLIEVCARIAQGRAEHR
jgi:uncharacterized protein (TIGR00299 family) protein